MAVVTGGANGIGFGIAKRFIDEGMRVVLADYDQAALDEAIGTIGLPNDRIVGVRTDVSLAEDVEALAAQATDRFGPVHVLVNNAGVNAYGYSSWETPRATWDWVLGVNLFGAVNGIRAFLPGMMERDEGHVINTASGAALDSAPMRSAYCASKHALLALSESTQLELEQHGSAVRLSVLIPGTVLTSIRSSAERWPERLGPNVALGPAHTSFSLPLTAESGAKDPAVPAAAVWDALQSGRFLINVSDRGLNVLLTRVKELVGLSPTVADAHRTGSPTVPARSERAS